MYEEWESVIPGAVVWRKETAPDAPGAPVAPDGCMDVIWVDGDLIVAGPDTRPNYSPTRRGATLVAVRFGPGTAPGVLGVPAAELRDSRTPLASLWPEGSVRSLADRVGDAADPCAVLEHAMVDVARHAEPVDRSVRGVLARARSGTPVAEMADAVGLSERQLHRRCLTAFGYGPKTLSRILRMNRALTLVRTGVSFADVAATAGYADQAHLSRDVRSLTGLTLSDHL